MVDEFLTAFFAHVCEQPLSAFIDAEAIEQIAEKVCAPSSIERLLERFAQPSRARIIAKLMVSRVKGAAWWPDELRNEFAEVIGQPVELPKVLVDGIINSPELRREVRALLEEALSNFVDKGMAAMPQKGVLGLMSFGAKAAGAVGKGILGGIGGNLIQEYTDRAVLQVIRRIGERLTSPKTAIAIGERLRAGFLRSLRIGESDVGKFLNWLPLDIFESMVPRFVAHNFARKEVRDTLTGEIAFFLAEISQQTVGGFLDELGLRQIALDATLRLGTPLIDGFVASPHFVPLTKQ
jgi:hypothetical protein